MHIVQSDSAIWCRPQSFCDILFSWLRGVMHIEELNSAVWCTTQILNTGWMQAVASDSAEWCTLLCLHTTYTTLHITEFLKNSNISGKSKCFSGARGFEYKNRGRKSRYTPLQNIWQFELWNFLFWQLFRKISRLVEIFWVLFYEYSMTGLVGAESQSWRLTLKARLRNTANIYYLD